MRFSRAKMVQGLGSERAAARAARQQPRPVTGLVVLACLLAVFGPALLMVGVTWRTQRPFDLPVGRLREEVQAPLLWPRDLHGIVCRKRYEGFLIVHHAILVTGAFPTSEIKPYLTRLQKADYEVSRRPDDDYAKTAAAAAPWLDLAPLLHGLRQYRSSEVVALANILVMCWPENGDGDVVWVSIVWPPGSTQALLYVYVHRG